MRTSIIAFMGLLLVAPAIHSAVDDPEEVGLVYNYGSKSWTFCGNASEWGHFAPCIQVPTRRGLEKHDSQLRAEFESRQAADRKVLLDTIVRLDARVAELEKKAKVAAALPAVPRN